MKTFRLLNSRRTLAAALVALPLLALTLAGCNQSRDSSAPATMGTAPTGTATTTTNAAPSTPAASEAAGAAFVLDGTQKRDVTPTDLAAAEKTRTAGVVSRDKKTLTFAASTIRLVVRTGPDNDMLSYRIQGLRNPALVVPKGATLKVLFVSTDYHGEAGEGHAGHGDGHEGHDHAAPSESAHEMRHDLRFGDRQPPFPATSGLDGTVGSARLMAMEKDRFPAEDMTLRAPSATGAYTYFCSVSGHAQGGMWGKVTVR